MNNRGRALADPSTCARVDARIEQFRIRDMRMLPSTIVAALTDAGLSSDAAEILAQAVLTRIGERVSPADNPAPRLRSYAGT